jgi:GT2 family glycosyltransferase
VSAPPWGQTVPDNRFDLLDGITPEAAPDVTVIVAHYAQPGPLRRTLAAIAAQTHPASRLQTIVVDDGSPETPEVPPGVTLLRQEDRGVRPGAARNLGAAHADGDVLCFLDADTAPEPGYVSALTRLPALAPEAVTVARRRHADLSALAPGAPLSEAAEVELPEPGWLRDGYAATRNLRDADERSYRYVISAVLACARWFFGEVGPFADFDAYGGEDWEWGHRAWRAGAILAHVPEAVAWHDGPEWSMRGADETRRAVKNAETRRLARLIGVPGSRGRGLRPLRAEIVIRIPEPGSASAAFLCVDSLLAALPDATVVLPASDAARFPDDGRVRAARADGDPALAWPALELTVHRPLEADPGRLRAICEEVRRTGSAHLELCDEHGPLLTLADVRARTRARRWGDVAAAADTHRETIGVAALEREPDLEAWVGGWANSRLRPPPSGTTNSY